MSAQDSCGPFFALAAACDELVFVWKVTGEMLWVNPSFERETGMNAADYGFRNADNPFIHPEDLPSVLAAINRFIDSDANNSPPIDNRFFDMWGRCRRLRSTVHKIDWNGESVLMFVSRFSDRPEDDSDSDDRYRRLVEAADDGILQLDGKGRIATANRRMHDLTGRRHIEMVRRPLANLFVPHDRNAALAAWARLQEGASTASFQARLEGRERWLDVKLARLEGGNPSVVALAIARDVTETRRLEAEILRREKDESLGLLVGGIAHDLNNILTAVIANASDAADQLEPGSPLAQALADVQLAGEHAAVLGRSMLAYLGQAPTTVTRIELDQLVRDTVRVVGPLLGPTVAVHLNPVSDTVLSGDAGQIGQIIMNLLTNAAQALGSRGGNIRIETQPITLLDVVSDVRPAPLAPGRYVRMLVADDGPGMPAEVMERIFDPYFTTKARGRGLGLATTLGVLRRHGGAVRVSSSAGHGTAFEVFLPIAEHEAITPRPTVEAPAAKPASRRRATVLFVDDEEAILRMAQRVLDRAGHRTITASRGAQALQLFQSEPVNAVVLDSTLPDADGNTIAAKMRELVPGIPILRSSGYQAAGLVPDGEPFLPKPYRVNDLLAAVESLLAQ
jgi:two-component system cell cycle sensor histidine kinase/response regulator CckA